MRTSAGFEGREEQIADLFTQTFTAAEGPEEGALVGSLARDLLARTPPDEIRVFTAMDDGRLIAVAVFTRLTFPEDPRHVVLLSPMAVATDRQRQGIGQALIAGALQSLRAEGAEVAITYGDPDYYRRVGFVPVSPDQATPPFPLSFPHGWIAQSLTSDEMPALSGKPTCVAALDRTDIW
ncbi:N-acetyltransferase [Sulfitobacter sp. LCG007]